MKNVKDDVTNQLGEASGAAEPFRVLRVALFNVPEAAAVAEVLGWAVVSVWSQNEWTYLLVRNRPQ